MFFWIKVITILIILLICYNFTKDKLIKKIFLIMISIVLIILLGFRKYTLGLNDVQNVYMPIYNNYIIGKNYMFIINTLKDPIFYCFMKLISTIFKSFQAVLICYSIIVVLILMRFFYKESKSLAISLFIFIALNFFGTAFSGLRHIVALSILLLSYKYYKGKNLKKFIFFVLIASCFHLSALSFLLAYFDYYLNKKNNKKVIFVLNILLLLLFIFMKLGGNNIVFYCINEFVNLLKLSRFEDYTQKGYSSLNNLLFIINYVIFAFSSFVYCNVDIKNSTDKRKYESLLNLQFIGTLFCCFIGVLGEFNRIAMFFTIFSTILIPETLNYIKKGKDRVILEIIIIALLIIYFLFFGVYNYKLVPFEFFWN